MTSKLIHVSATPGQAEITCNGTLFRLAVFPDAPALCWVVYGGDDGQIIVYKPELRRWERLLPTRKTNDYLFVSIAKDGGRYWQPYVHAVILHAFEGPPPTKTSVAKHLNDDPHDNRRSNLSWGTKSENAVEAHRHRRLQSPPSGRRISIPVRREVYDESAEKVSGTVFRFRCGGRGDRSNC